MKEFTIKAEPLLRCPFCGGEMKIILMQPLSPLLKDEYHFACKNMCITSRKSYETEIEAIKACNSRKPMERILERLEEYRDDFMNDIYEELRDDLDNLRANRIIDRFDESIEIVKEEGGIK